MTESQDELNQQEPTVTLRTGLRVNAEEAVSCAGTLKAISKRYPRYFATLVKLAIGEGVEESDLRPEPGHHFPMVNAGIIERLPAEILRAGLIDHLDERGTFHDPFDQSDEATTALIEQIRDKLDRGYLQIFAEVMQRPDIPQR